jgi:hopanoid-associated phosphorylase
MKREAAMLRGLQARVIVGGAGIAEAARAVSAIVSFGLCGGLDPALKAGDLVVGSGVIADGERFAADRAWAGRLASALLGAPTGDFASGGAMAADVQAKAALRRGTGAVAVDMESHLVARTGLPFAVIRAVSDPADRSLPIAAQAGFGADGEADVGAVIASLLRRPHELPALIGVARDASAAFRSLARAAAALASVPGPA